MPSLRRHRRGRHRPLAVPESAAWRDLPMRHDGVDYLGRSHRFAMSASSRTGLALGHMAGLIAAAKAAGQGAEPGSAIPALPRWWPPAPAPKSPMSTLQEGDRLGPREPGDGRARANRSAGCRRRREIAEREERRGSRYDIILFDPPAYGAAPRARSGNVRVICLV